MDAVVGWDLDPCTDPDDHTVREEDDAILDSFARAGNDVDPDEGVTSEFRCSDGGGRRFLREAWGGCTKQDDDRDKEEGDLDGAHVPVLESSTNE